MTTSSGRSSIYKVPLSVQNSYYTIEALAKGTYERMFNWIVRKINQSIELRKEDLDYRPFTIGVLDIYGFEIFEVNISIPSHKFFHRATPLNNYVSIM